MKSKETKVEAQPKSITHLAQSLERSEQLVACTHNQSTVLLIDTFRSIKYPQNGALAA